MSEKTKQNKQSTWLRREFIGGCTAGLAGLSLAGCAKSQESDEKGQNPSKKPHPSEWWVAGEYVKHETVNIERLDQGVIRARIQGEWQDFNIVKLPRRFVDWSLSERMKRLQKLADHGFDPRDLDGPHNACVATFGGWKRDSAVSLNTAYKGMGFVPKPEKLKQTILMLKEASERIGDYDADGFMGAIRKKTDFLATLYSDTDLFDKTKQVSLELFTSPTYATHSFLNMMANPIASASFLAYPTFELRTVPQLLHPNNPALSDNERGIVNYTNAVHDFVHGGNEQKLTCVYHIIEVYDDTPNAQGHGQRIA